MTTSLAEAISTFFDVSNGADINRLAGCFTADAVVRDEGRTHQGHQAIEAWLRDAQEKIQFTVAPLNTVVSGNCVTVTTRIVGNFKGSPVQLDHIFVLNDDKIQSLVIG